ncbi:hypothetical protein LNO92_10580 [Klebsiella variicola subsp. variicola]|nr:hypothetical protein [Klebsiella variicola subsp. variicola]
MENRERERRYYPVSYHDDNVLIGKVGDKHGIFRPSVVCRRVGSRCATTRF